MDGWMGVGEALWHKVSQATDWEVILRQGAIPGSSDLPLKVSK